MDCEEKYFWAQIMYRKLQFLRILYFFSARFQVLEWIKSNTECAQRTRLATEKY